MQFTFDHLSFMARYPSPEVHSHFAKHLIFAASGTLHCSVAGETFECEGVAIDSSAPHTVSAQDPPMWVCLFDETGDRAEALAAGWLRGRPFAVLDGALCKKAQAALARGESEETLLRLCGLNGLCGREPGRYAPGVAAVLELVDSAETLEAGAVRRLCRAACLSESRLSHLFRQQVGISLAGYLRFSKLAKAYRYLDAGETVTQAALHAGFASPSHFAAVNRQHFGLSVTDLGPVPELFKTAEK